MAAYAIETHQLCKNFGQVKALENINIRIKQGEFVSIMGASGSGKTTLMNLLSCLDTPSSGSLKLEGKDISAFDENARRRFRAETIGLVFQKFHLIPYLSALENVMLAQHYHSITDSESAQAALYQVGLEHRLNHLPHQLSGGEQQRVCIARAIVNECPILFADEPTGNLDEKNEQLILSLFNCIHSNNRTIIMITHNQSLSQLTDRTIHLQHGKQLD